MGGNKFDATRVVVIPDYLFDRLISEPNGENLVALWIRYARQARMQGGEETKSYDGFIRSQLGWGVDKLKTAKKALKDLGLIDTERTENGDWVTKVYGEFEEEDGREINGLKIRQLVGNPQVENPGVIDDIIIDNNIIINNKEEDKREAKKPKKEKSEEEKTKSKELNEVIARYYDAINDCGLIPKKEVNEFVGITAFRSLINSVYYEKASEGIGKAELTYAVAKFGLMDEFWGDKVLSPSGFSRHFATLFAQAKKAGKLKAEKKLKEEDLKKLEEGWGF